MKKVVIKFFIILMTHFISANDFFIKPTNYNLKETNNKPEYFKNQNNNKENLEQKNDTFEIGKHKKNIVDMLHIIIQNNRSKSLYGIAIGIITSIIFIKNSSDIKKK